jgi:predicted NUDIX family NTP pyrophosphohydrolase
MPEISAGVLAWRAGAAKGKAGPEFLLVHPGGPFWANKDEAAWSIPKGLVEPDEDGWAAARREFEEELGSPITGEPVELPPVKTSGGKVVHAWLVETDLESPRFAATPSRWSGRRDPAVGRPFRKSIAPAGSTLRPPVGRSTRDSGRSWRQRWQ